MTLDDLRNIDLNNISGWPLPVKIGGIIIVCLIILGAGVWFIVQPEWEDFKRTQAQEEQLKTTYSSKA